MKEKLDDIQILEMIYKRMENSTKKHLDTISLTNIYISNYICHAIFIVHTNKITGYHKNLRVDNVVNLYPIIKEWIIKKGKEYDPSYKFGEPWHWHYKSKEEVELPLKLVELRAFIKRLKNEQKN